MKKNKTEIKLKPSQFKTIDRIIRKLVSDYLKNYKPNTRVIG